MKNATICCALAVYLTACGNAVEKLNSQHNGLTSGRASGHAVDAMIVGGTVSIYAFDTGTKGDLLGTAMTDETGRYALSLQTTDRPIYVELSGGQYVEEATGKSVTLSPTQRLRAVTHYRPGDTITAMITPWTTIATGLAEYRVAQGQNPDNAITAANVAISTVVGLDILNVYPRNITDAANDGALDNERMYGIIEAGMSLWAAWASQQNGPAGKIPVSSIGLSQIMYDDMRADGLLDGFTVVEGKQVRLAAGNVTLDANVYRSGFASQMLNALADPNINRTSLTIDNALSNTQRISMSRSAVFGNIVQPVNVDRDPPIVINNFADGQFVAGVVSYSAKVSDFVGVASIAYDVDGADIQKATDVAHPVVLITTTKYTDGPHKIGVRAKDNIGNETYVQYTLNFVNSGVLTTFNCATNPCVTNQTSYTMNGAWRGNGSGMPTIQVQGKNANVRDDGTWDAQAALKIGVNSVTIHTIDALGIVTDTTVSIGVDVNAPKLFWGSGMPAFFVNPNDPNPYQRDFIQTNTAVMPLWVYQDKISANGVALNANDLAAVQIPSISWSAYDDCQTSNAVNAPCSSADKLSVTMEYTQNADWTAATRVTVSPTVGTAWIDGLLAPITEFMRWDWDKAPMDTTHNWRITVTDMAGNSSEIKFYFRANVFQTFSPSASGKAQPLMKATVVTNFTQGVTWAARNTLYAAPQLIESYTYDNSNGSAHYVSFEDTGSTYNAVQTIDAALRENQYFTTKTTMWQGRRTSTSSLPPINPAWVSITSFVECSSGATYTVPAPVVSNPVVIQQEDFPVALADSGWNDYDPFPTKCYDSSGLGTTFWYSQYSVSSGVYLYYLEKSTSLIGQVYTVRDSGGTHFQQRVTVTPSYVAGYPRTNWGTQTENYTTGFIGSYRMFNLAGGEIKPNKSGGQDWYLVLAGQTVTIKRFVTPPSIVSHNDPEICASLTQLVNGVAPVYKQYTTQFCDKQVDFTLRAGEILLHRVHTSDITRIGSMPDSANFGYRADSLIGGQKVTLSMTRPTPQ